MLDFNKIKRERFSTVEKDLEALIKSSTQTTSGLKAFMQTLGQLLNVNSQDITRLEMQGCHLASVIDERKNIL